MAYNQPDYEEDLDCIDFQNYKGMFYNDDPGLKYQDEITGAHFEHKDMCRRLEHLKRTLQHTTKENNDSITALSEFVNGTKNQRQKSAINKEPFKLIPQVQATRNPDTRPAHLYSTTVGDLKKKNLRNENNKLNIPRNHSIIHKRPNEMHEKPSKNVKEAYYKGATRVKKGEKAT